MPPPCRCVMVSAPLVVHIYACTLHICGPKCDFVFCAIVSRSSDCTRNRTHVLQSHGFSELQRNICARLADEIFRRGFACRRRCPLASSVVSADRACDLLKRSLLPVLIRSVVCVYRVARKSSHFHSKLYRCGCWEVSESRTASRGNVLRRCSFLYFFAH